MPPLLPHFLFFLGGLTASLPTSQSFVAPYFLPILLVFGVS
jgi:hypothetical protein